MKLTDQHRILLLHYHGMVDRGGYDAKLQRQLECTLLGALHRLEKQLNLPRTPARRHAKVRVRPDPKRKYIQWFKPGKS